VETAWKTTTWTTLKEMGDNVKMDFREIGCEDERWMELAQDRVHWRALVSAVVNNDQLMNAV
jgi:hypothetical protein